MPWGKNTAAAHPARHWQAQGAPGPLSPLETRCLHQPAQPSQAADSRRTRGIHRRHEYPQPPPTLLNRYGNRHPRHALSGSGSGRGRPATDLSGRLVLRDRRTVGHAHLLPGAGTPGRGVGPLHKRRPGQGIPQTRTDHNGSTFLRQKVRTHHEPLLRPRPPDDCGPDHHRPARRGRAYYPARHQQPAFVHWATRGCFGELCQRHQGILPAAAVRPYQAVSGGWRLVADRFGQSRPPQPAASISNST